jgi:hypothetical protein
MWFGRGLPEGSKSTAVLADTSQTEPIPREFGCLIDDIEISKTQRHFPLLLPWEGVTDVKFNCAKPAYGPESRVWTKTPLNSDDIVPAKYFYQYDPKSPIEWQTKACDGLKNAAKNTCNDDDCDVLVDVPAGKSCNDICQHHGLECTRAGEEIENSCKQNTTIQLSCSDSFDTSDLLCKCQIPAAKRNCGKLGNVWARCPGATTGVDQALDPCNVLVNTFESEFATCDAFCASANLACQSAYASKAYRCDARKKNVPPTCQTPLDKGEPKMVCVCDGAAVTPTPP